MPNHFRGAARLSEDDSVFDKHHSQASVCRTFLQVTPVIVLRISMSGHGFIMRRSHVLPGVRRDHRGKSSVSEHDQLTSLGSHTETASSNPRILWHSASVSAMH